VRKNIKVQKTFLSEQGKNRDRESTVKKMKISFPSTLFV
jgi:hypothetical protein